MKQIIYHSYEELSLKTADKIAEIINEKPSAMLCFPAGETSIGTFAELVKMSKNGLVDFSNCKIVGLDEWVHLGKMEKENCYHFLKKYLFDFIEIKPENFCFFNGEAEDLQAELDKTNRFIKNNGGIDMMLLGIGMNGHLGLNEPRTSLDSDSYIVELDSVTQSVGQKYFSEEVKLTKGITLGMKQIMDSKTVILQLSGTKKKTVAKTLIETEPTTDFPATLVKNHPNSFLMMDNDAATDLSRN